MHWSTGNDHHFAQVEEEFISAVRCPSGQLLVSTTMAAAKSTRVNNRLARYHPLMEPFCVTVHFVPSDRLSGHLDYCRWHWQWHSFGDVIGHSLLARQWTLAACVIRLVCRARSGHPPGNRPLSTQAYLPENIQTNAHIDTQIAKLAN